MKDVPPPIKIYVGNIPASARNSELKELFEKFGKVVECDILKDFGFVHMEDKNDAKAAIAGLHDTLWKGCRVRVELSTTKTSKGEPSERNEFRRDSRGSSSRQNHRSESHRHNPMGHRLGGLDRRDGPYGGPSMNDRPPRGFPPRGDRGERNGDRGGGPMRDSRGGGRSYPMGGGGGPSGRYPMSDYDEPPYGRGGPMMSGPPFNGGGGGFPPSVAYRGPPAPPYRGEIYDAQDLSHELMRGSDRGPSNGYDRGGNGYGMHGGRGLPPPPRDDFGGGYRGGPHHLPPPPPLPRYDNYAPPPRGGRYNNF